MEGFNYISFNITSPPRTKSSTYLQATALAQSHSVVHLHYNGVQEGGKVTVYKYLSGW